MIIYQKIHIIKNFYLMSKKTKIITQIEVKKEFY